MGRPRRRGLVVALIVAGTITGVFAIGAVWLNRQALNTDNWTDASSQLLDSEPIRNTVAAFLVDEMYTSLDPATQIRDALPPRARPLAGPAAGGLRTLADRGMQELLQRPRVQLLWEQANRRAHRRLMQVLEGGGDTVSTGNGDVTLDLGTLLSETASSLGVGGRLVSKLPADAAQIEILQSGELSTAQDGAQVLRGLAIVLPLLSLALFATAVGIAGRRREALRAVGFAFIAVGVIALLARSAGGSAVTSSFADTASVRPAAEDVWRIGTSLLSEAAVSTLGYGVAIVLIAWLAGPTRLAVGTRRALAPYLRQPRYAYGALALLLLLLIVWGPTPATRKPLSLLLLAGLLALGVEVLRRQTAREFPGATTEGAMERMRERWEGMRGAAGPTGGRADTSGVADSGGDALLGSLERLGQLKQRGVLNEAEFAREKTRILGNGAAAATAAEAGDPEG